MTPGLLFPTISLILLAQTQRYLALATLIRKLHADWRSDNHSDTTATQIRQLSRRMVLIRWMQLSGIASLLGCLLSMLLLAINAPGGLLAFIAALILMTFSLLTTAREIQVSSNALDIELSDMRNDPGVNRTD